MSAGTYRHVDCGHSCLEAFTLCFNPTKVSRYCTEWIRVDPSGSEWIRVDPGSVKLDPRMCVGVCLRPHLTVCILTCIFTAVSGLKNVETLLEETRDNSVAYKLDDWFHCPAGWTLFQTQCYKVTSEHLTWTQAQALCRSYSGSLATTSSQYEQEWLSQFVKEQLFNDSQSRTTQKTILNHGTNIQAWIGLVRLSNKTFQWADGKLGVEQSGFWAVDGWKVLAETSNSKVCCGARSDPYNDGTLRWYLTSCHELHPSVCQLEACEGQTVFCAGSSRCINRAWLCDGHWDCQDGWDEQGCSNDQAISAGQSCGGVLRQESGLLWSPGYPTHYPPFLNCSWRIEVPPPLSIKILVHWLELEEDFDSLKIYDGTETDLDHLVVSLSGGVVNRTVKSLGSFLTLHLLTDYSVQAAGFKISWTADVTPGIGAEHQVARETESYLTFEATNEETLLSCSHLSAGTFRCDWIISSWEQSDVLSLQFKNLSVAHGDSLVIFDGQRSDAPVISHITSDAGVLVSVVRDNQSSAASALMNSLNWPPVITSSGQHLLLRLVVNKGSRSSFTAVYKSGCEVSVLFSSSVILSPGYPHVLYPNNLKCTWSLPILAGSSNLTTIFLPDFYTEANRDFVRVLSLEGGKQDARVTVLSGSNPHLQPITSSHGLLVKFESDSNINRGHWAALTSYNCEIIPAVLPLAVNSSDLHFGAVVKFSCIRGFQLVGTSQAVCGWEGHWQPPKVPECEKINCGSVPVPSHAYVINVTGITYGSTATYNCLNGYHLVGSGQAICKETGWENVPECRWITCPKEYPPVGGSAKAETIEFGYMREFFCQPHLKLSGSKFSHCNVSGQWSHQVPSCEEAKCPNLLEVKNGKLNTTEDVARGQSVAVVCREGYRLVGHNFLTCMDNLMFDHPVPFCVDVDECEGQICGIHYCQNTIGGYNCLCRKGYHPDPHSIHDCIDTDECETDHGGCSHQCTNLPGSFQCECPHQLSLYTGAYDLIDSISLIPNKTCISWCEPLTATEGMHIIYSQKPMLSNHILQGTKARLICAGGLYPIGASVLSCVAGFGWSSHLSACTELTCEKPRNMTNGKVEYTSLTLGSSAVYTCHADFKLVGPSVRFCQLQANNASQNTLWGWTGLEPQCVVVECPAPTSPVHGTVNFRTRLNNSLAVFRCLCGYKLVGQSVLRCTSDGTWNFPPPVCNVKACRHPGIPTGATLSEFTPGFPVGSTVSFKCVDKGYQLSEHTSIKCMAQRESKVSVIQPALDLTLSGLYVTIKPTSPSTLTDTCNQLTTVEDFVGTLSSVLPKQCEQLHVNVDYQKKISINLTDEALNITAHLLLSPRGTASATCQCYLNMLTYIMNQAKSVTLSSLSRRCLNFQLQQNASLSMQEHWLCPLGLRLQNEQLSCSGGQGLAPTCMEDCLGDDSDKKESEFYPTSVLAPSSHTKYRSASSSVFDPFSLTTWKATISNVNIEKGQYIRKSVVSNVTFPPASIRNNQNPLELKLNVTKLWSPAAVTKLLNTFQTSSAAFSNSQDSTKTSMKGYTISADSFTSATTQSSFPGKGLKVPLTEEGSNSSSSSEKLSMFQQKISGTILPEEFSQSAHSVYEESSTQPTPVTVSLASGSSTQALSSEQMTKWMTPLMISFSPTKIISLIPVTVMPSTQSKITTVTPVMVRSHTSLGTLATATIPSYSEPSSRPVSVAVISSENNLQPASTIISASTHSLSQSVSITVTPSQEAAQKAVTVTTTVRTQMPQTALPSLTDFSTFHQIVGPTDTFSDLTLTQPHETNSREQANRPATNVITLSQQGTSLFPSTTEDYISDSSNNLVSSPQNLKAKMNLNSWSRDGQIETSNMFYQLNKMSSPNLLLSKIGHQTNSPFWSSSYISTEINKSHDELGSSNYFTTTLASESVSEWTLLTQENQKTTSVLVPGGSSPANSEPVYALEVHDYITGSFSNISCIDAVHVTINSKFIDVLQDFKSRMGNLVCPNVHSSSLTLADGNIRFREKMAGGIFLRFYISVSGSSKSEVERCSLDFQRFIASQLPARFKTVEREMEVLVCQSVNYTSQEFNMTDLGWRCQSNLTFNERTFQCEQSDTSFTQSRTTPILISRTSTDEFSNPPFIVRFYGTLPATNSSSDLKEHCAQDLKMELINVMSALEFHLKSPAFNATFQTNVNVTVIRHELIAEITMVLAQPKDNVDSKDLFKYGNLTQLQLLRGLNNAVPKFQLTGCPHLVLSALFFRTDQENGDKHKRRRRESQEFLPPLWSSTLPTCVDEEPPSFETCPLELIVLTLDQSGLPCLTGLPKVTDNSGHKPRVTLTPDITRASHDLFKNNSVMMIAEDKAGNVATCNISVVYLDQIPPSIMCPSHVVTLVANTTAGIATISYQNAGVVASDNSGQLRLIYDPPALSIVPSTGFLLVTASAIDQSFHVAKCSFFARIQISGCPEWVVPRPAGGDKSCIPGDARNQEVICTVSCPPDKAFVIQPMDKYVCHSYWENSVKVPDCVDGRLPNFEVRLSFHLPYQGTMTAECLKEMLNIFIESIRPKFLSVCNNAAQDLNLTHIDSVGTFPKGDLNMMKVKLKISIKMTPQNLAFSNATHLCGKPILNHLELNRSLQSECGQLHLSTPVAYAGMTSCSAGFAHLGNLCYQCPPGTYLAPSVCKDCPAESTRHSPDMVSCKGFDFDCPRGQYSTEPECLECPMGTYQSLAGSSKCLSCRPGFSTLDVGAKGEQECLAICQENHFSPTGLEPCLPCPLGTHQPQTGRQLCHVCHFDHERLSRIPYCQKPCPPGQFGLNGTSLCQPCPVNHYNPLNGSVSCLRCPDNKVTTHTGSISIRQCIDLACEAEVDSCVDHHCENDAECLKDNNAVKCMCQDGFFGVTCAQRVSVKDYCLSNPCLQGFCVNQKEGYSCLCHSGFTGQRCEAKVDYCGNVTCHNSGVCVDLGTGFKCSCPEGFTGSFCQDRTNSCMSSGCLNGGSCREGEPVSTCLCPKGYKGDQCEVSTDECVDSPCQNGGFCQDDVNSFVCWCQPEYTGKTCEIVVDPCQVLPCLHGGLCSSTNKSSQFRCLCPEGYTGTRCEVEVDYCLSSLCSLPGSVVCENSLSTYMCHCLPGWTGRHCDIRMDGCLDNPCRNGGVCENHGHFFTCACPPSYTGATCSIAVSSCLFQRCHNGGSCVWVESKYACLCLPGYNGSLCETNVNECWASPCLNGGVCQDGVDGFTCRCGEGFAGEMCEVEIDACQSQPCQHNSTCFQTDDHKFFCSCAPGFTGQFCQVQIDECLARPCQNQGHCFNLVSGFRCLCPEGYSGAVCDQVISENCNNSICLNQAKCQKVGGKDVCQCLPEFAGPNCRKEKTANFDLQFTREMTPMNLATSINWGNLTELTVVAWVQSSQPGFQGTFLVLEDNFVKILELTNSGLTSSLLIPEEKMALPVSDGLWHHISVVLTTSCWTVYQDGLKVGTEVSKNWSLGGSLSLKYGQLSQSMIGDDWFVGHLHGVNVYSYAVNETLIKNMSQNCSFNYPGDLFDWRTAQVRPSEQRLISMPSKCHQRCRPGSVQGPACSLQDRKDKQAPTVTDCPTNIVKTSVSGLTRVEWTEPDFLDNVGVVAVKQNFRPGQVFPLGQYQVIYIGYDAENNSALCSFQIVVRRSECVDPPPPSNGASSCRGWQDGRYCTATCLKNFHFIAPIPPFYRCGYTGVWDPPLGYGIFPPCVRAVQSQYRLEGSLTFVGSNCSALLSGALEHKLEDILAQLNSSLAWCGATDSCNYSHGMNITCEPGVGPRQKRDVRAGGGAVLAVKVNMTLNVQQPNININKESIPDQIVSLAKENVSEGEFNFSLSTTKLHLFALCQPGQMLINSDTPVCLDCPAGYFLSSQTACSPCPVGWYTDHTRQVACNPCPQGLTTYSQGASNVSLCLATCESGTYYSTSTDKCESCLKGEYQDKTSQLSCKPCSVGLTTQDIGSRTLQDCQDLCGAGQELGVGGTCENCPLGTYRAGSRSEVPFCVPCPYGWTTEKIQSVNQSQCTRKKCEKGQFYHLEEKRCHPCPLGTFQQVRGGQRCEACGVGLTTLQAGAVSRQLCRPGQVNECDLGLDNCGQYSQCVDQEEGFLCQCRYGRTITGECRDKCQVLCSKLLTCQDLKNVADSGCQCSMEICKDNGSEDSYKILISAVVTVAVVVAGAVFTVIVYCVHRRRKRASGKQQVKMYRDETELASFTNTAFDSFSSGRTESNKEEYKESLAEHEEYRADHREHRPDQVYHLPTLMATRWHYQSFMLFRPDKEDIT